MSASELAYYPELVSNALINRATGGAYGRSFEPKYGKYHSKYKEYMRDLALQQYN